MGIFLLEDDNGMLVDALSSEHQHNAEAITRTIFQRWITGTGRKPTTWRTLVHVLRECQLAAQADAIDAYYGGSYLSSVLTYLFVIIMQTLYVDM